MIEIVIGIDGRIRASAVTIFSSWPGACPLVATEKRTCIGSDQQFTVYFGKLYGPLMTLDFVVEDNSNQKVLIFTDNQAAITSAKQPKQQSGQYLLEEIALQIESLSRQLEVYWILAYSEVSIYIFHQSIKNNIDFSFPYDLIYCKLSITIISH